MNETAIMNYEARTSTNKGANKLLKRNGFIPANITGKGMDSISIAVRSDEFRKSLKKFGRNSVFKLENKGGNAFTVIVRELQMTPIVNDYSHVDFQQVSLSEEIKTDVSIRLLGVELLESKRLLINRQLDNITVIGFPQDVPDTIEIDVSDLNAGDNIKVSDIKFTEGIRTEHDLESIILTISEPKVQEVVEVTEE